MSAAPQKRRLGPVIGIVAVAVFAGLLGYSYLKVQEEVANRPPPEDAPAEVDADADESGG